MFCECLERVTFPAVRSSRRDAGRRARVVQAKEPSHDRRVEGRQVGANARLDAVGVAGSAG